MQKKEVEELERKWANRSQREEEAVSLANAFIEAFRQRHPIPK
jgi:hypothetical protein